MKNPAPSVFIFSPQLRAISLTNEDAILIKDLARETLRGVDGNGRKDFVRSDIDRIVGLSAELRSNGTHGKVVFASAAQNIWQEYEVPATLGSTQIFVGRHFHLKPLVYLLAASPRLGVVLVDRHRARIFEFCQGELVERDDLFHPLTRRGRSDGFAGYDGGHAQRRVEDEVRHHFKNVSATVKRLLDQGVFERWILACQDAHLALLDPQLCGSVSRALIGHFHADLGHITHDEIRALAQPIVETWQQDRQREAVGQALSQACSKGRGVTGLRRVLRSLEAGEVQTLLIGENLQAHAVECSGCGHIDAHLVSHCPVCGHATQEVVDVGEAILPLLLRHDIETIYIKEDAEFDRVGNIAALLRFRAEKTPSLHAALSRMANFGASMSGRTAV